MERRAYAFTDPVGASDPGGTRRRIRHALALIHGAGALSLLMALPEVDGPLAQSVVDGIAAGLTAVVCVLVLAWRDVPDRGLVAGFPLAALVVTAVCVLDPPLALTPMFYVWPLVGAAAFLRERELLVTYATAVLSFGAAIPWIEPRPTPIQWLTVAIVGGVVLAFVRRLTLESDRQARRLTSLAREDPLTGALNRRAIVGRLEEELVHARRSGTWPAVAVLDVDRFKDINDRFGHAAGDEALRGLVRTVTARLRAGDALGRLGGEEFLVVLADTDAAGAAAYAEDVRVLVAAEAAATTAFTVSVGVAAPRGSAATAEALLSAADAALYRAKHAGRNAVRAA